MLTDEREQEMITKFEKMKLAESSSDEPSEDEKDQHKI